MEPSRPVQACNWIASPKHNLKVNRNGLVGAVTEVWVGRAGFRITTEARDFFRPSKPFPGLKQLGLGVDR